MLGDGSNIPKWLKFYSHNLTFIGTPDIGGRIYSVNLTAIDQYLSNATIQFKILVDSKNFVSKLGLKDICIYANSQSSDLLYLLPSDLFPGTPLQLKLAAGASTSTLPPFLSFNQLQLYQTPGSALSAGSWTLMLTNG